MSHATACSIDAPGRGRGKPDAERTHRGTIFVEEAKLLAQQEYPGRQYVIRLHAPRCAATAQPGSFVHLTCDAEHPMRRPLSLMRVDAQQGWIDILYKVVGAGLDALSRQPVGATISVLGPIGQGFVAHPERPRTLLIGGGVGIPPMVFLAESLKARASEANWQPLVLMGSEIEFPFTTRPSQILLPGLPPCHQSCRACAATPQGSREAGVRASGSAAGERGTDRRDGWKRLPAYDADGPRDSYCRVFERGLWAQRRRGCRLRPVLQEVGPHHADYAA